MTTSTTEQAGQQQTTGTEGKAPEGQQQTEGQQQAESKAPAAGKYAHLTDVTALQALAERLDREAAESGSKSRDNARKTAAAEAEQRVRDEVAKALGLTPASADPAAMASEIQQLRSANLERDRELAVYRAALKPGAGVDVGRLTDSRSFMRAVEQQITDPNADDTPAKLAALIRDAVASDQSLRVRQASPGGTVEHPGGAGDRGNPDLSKLHGADAMAAAYAQNASK